jgi:hypothetical protein
MAETDGTAVRIARADTKAVSLDPRRDDVGKGGLLGGQK